MTKARRWAAMASATVLATVLAACGQANESKPAPATPAGLVLAPSQRQKIGVERMVLSHFRRTIETTGTVAFDQNRATQVLAPIAGPVSRLLVQVGAAVQRGEALATVASPDFAAAVSGLRKTEALARNARRIANLDQELFKNDAIARRDFEQAQTDAVSAEADRDSALQALRALGVDDKRLAEIRENRPLVGAGGVIRSPIAGTVVERLITPGQLLQAGTTPCFTVADLSTVWVMANVFEADLPSVVAGDPAEVRTESSADPLPGRVDYIAALVDPTTRAIAVRIVVPNPQRLLRRDLYVRVAIRSRRESTGLLAPVAAVLRDDENLPFVFVANADGSFSRRRVTLGARAGDGQEITSGLAAGESIAVQGALFMQSAENR